MPPHSKSFFATVLGVLYAPRATFRDIAAAPRWMGVMLFSVLISAGTTATVLETDVGRFALLDQWERTLTAFGHPVDDREYETLRVASDQGALVALASSLVVGPLLTIVVAGLLSVTVRPPRKKPTYRQVLAVVAYAGVVLTLRQVVAAPLTYARETLASPLTLRPLFSGLDEATALGRFSSGIDLFVIWWVIVLAIGSSVIGQRPARRLAVAYLAAYVAVVATMTVTVLWTGG